MTDHTVFVAGLRSILDGTFKVMDSRSVAAFLAVIESRFGRRGVILGRDWQYRYDVDEVANLIVAFLMANPWFCEELLAPSTVDPFKYLGASMTRWFRDDAGYHMRRTFDRHLNTADGRGVEDIVPADATASRAAYHIDDDRLEARLLQMGRVTRTGLLDLSLPPRLPEAIDLTVDTLERRTPNRVRPLLTPAVTWLAHNPVEHAGHERVTLDDASSEFPQLHPMQIGAIANIVWGGRPNQAETSILGGYLRDRDFLPTERHVKALDDYKRRINRRTLSAA